MKIPNENSEINIVTGSQKVIIKDVSFIFIKFNVTGLLYYPELC